MPYSAEISRSNPSCFLFIVDQSGSMHDGWGGDPTKRKADMVATIINNLLSNLVLKCAKDEGIRNYFEVGVLGYGTRAGSAFGGALAGKSLVLVSDLADNPLRLEERLRKQDDGAGGILETKVKFPVWFDPVAGGGTPMCHVLSLAQTILADWIRKHPDSFPPIAFNITDGESTDGDPAQAAAAVRHLATSDGSVLLFNLHLSAHKAAPVSFPHHSEGLPDEFAVRLFGMSSELPDGMRAKLREEGYSTESGSRGFVFNADPVVTINFLDIGTRPANLR